jgi:hypothetical protein
MRTAILPYRITRLINETSEASKKPKTPETTKPPEGGLVV